MKTCFSDLNGKKLVIGLVHLLPMAGTPLYEEGNIDKMTRKAVEDCKTLQANGADGCLIQTVDVYYPSTDDTDYARVAFGSDGPCTGCGGRQLYHRCTDHVELYHAITCSL